mmetsp:Transcript_25920/g.40239  ORF Transcript_25920/g.40239 Transcript_25920/m.40239 type:complete len:81 (-) Transcript_25920:2753-2995(-)
MSCKYGVHLQPPWLALQVAGNIYRQSDCVLRVRRHAVMQGLMRDDSINGQWMAASRKWRSQRSTCHTIPYQAGQLLFTFL